MEERSIQLFLVDNLSVVKISVERFFIKGSKFDRDIYGAQLANISSWLMIE